MYGSSWLTAGAPEFPACIGIVPAGFAKVHLFSALIIIDEIVLQCISKSLIVAFLQQTADNRVAIPLIIPWVQLQHHPKVVNGFLHLPELLPEQVGECCPCLHVRPGASAMPEMDFFSCCPRERIRSELLHGKLHCPLVGRSGFSMLFLPLCDVPFEQVGIGAGVIQPESELGSRFDFLVRSLCFSCLGNDELSQILHRDREIFWWRITTLFSELFEWRSAPLPKGERVHCTIDGLAE